MFQQIYMHAVFHLFLQIVGLLGMSVETDDGGGGKTVVNLCPAQQQPSPSSSSRTTLACAAIVDSGTSYVGVPKVRGVKVPNPKP